MIHIFIGCPLPLTLPPCTMYPHPLPSSQTLPCCLVSFVCWHFCPATYVCAEKFLLTELLKLERLCQHVYTTGTLYNSKLKQDFTDENNYGCNFIVRICSFIFPQWTCLPSQLFYVKNSSIISLSNLSHVMCVNFYIMQKRFSIICLDQLMSTPRTWNFFK